MYYTRPVEGVSSRRLVASYASSCCYPPVLGSRLIQKLPWPMPGDTSCGSLEGVGNVRRNALMRPPKLSGEEADDRTSVLTRLRLRQTEDWRGGSPRPAEDYLADAGGLEPDDRLVLVIGELMLRWERGERPELA